MLIIERAQHALCFDFKLTILPVGLLESQPIVW